MKSSQADNLSRREKMTRYVRDNYHSEHIQPFPQEWLLPEAQAEFNAIAEHLLGEDRADWWLHNKVFGTLSFMTDFDAPIDDQPDISDDLNFSSFATKFLENYGIFLSEVHESLCRSPRYFSDPEQVGTGVVNGVRYALNVPKEGNMDQRLNFFVQFPDNLQPENILSVLNDKTAANSLIERIKRGLKSYRFSLNRVENMTSFEVGEGFRSIYECRSSTGSRFFKSQRYQMKKEMIEALSSIGFESSKGLSDGVFDYLEQIIKNDNEDLKAFVLFHIRNRTLSARTAEGNRKQTELSYERVNDVDEELPLPVEMSVEEDVTENGVHRTTSARNHIASRKETRFEREAVAKKSKELTNQNLREILCLVEFIVEQLEDDVQHASSKDYVNDSDKLSILLPEALLQFTKVALRQVDKVIDPDNEIRSKNIGEGITYKKGRSAVCWSVEKGQDLGSLVDLNSLDEELSPYRIRKRRIYEHYLILDSHGNCRSVDDIAKTLNEEFDEDFSKEEISRTIEQIRVLRRPLKSWPHFYDEVSSSIVDSISLSLSALIDDKDSVSHLIQGRCRNHIKICTVILDRLSKSTGLSNVEVQQLFNHVFDSNMINDISDTSGLSFDNVQKILSGQIKDPVIEAFDKKLRANVVKNGFSWRWGRILKILYAPTKPLQTLDGKTINEDWFVKKAFRPKNEYFKINGRPVKLSVNRRLKRVFHSIPQNALNGLRSLLTVHAYIERGTIPKQIRSGRSNQPGAAWGHNICREIGESNVRMFYDIFYGNTSEDGKRFVTGLDRNEYAEVRQRCAEIIRLRRKKNS